MTLCSQNESTWSGDSITLTQRRSAEARHPWIRIFGSGPLPGPTGTLLLLLAIVVIHGLANVIHSAITIIAIETLALLPIAMVHCFPIVVPHSVIVLTVVPLAIVILPVGLPIVLRGLAMVMPAVIGMMITEKSITPNHNFDRCLAGDRGLASDRGLAAGRGLAGARGLAGIENSISINKSSEFGANRECFQS